MAHDKKHHRNDYMVAWIGEQHPAETRGILFGFHTKREAERIAAFRNKVCPHEFFWVIKLPHQKGSEQGRCAG
jgi:hypothetical protein